MRWLLTGLKGLLVVGAVFQVLIFVTHAYATVTFPYQLDFGEGAVLCLAETLRRGEPIYRSLNEPPYLAGLYAPLFPWIASWFLVGLPSFAAGRLLAAGSTLLIALISGLWLGRRFGKASGVVAAGVWLANPVVLGWSCLERIDTLGLLLTWMGLVAVATAPDQEDSSQPQRDGWAAVLFTLAFYVKQTFVSAPTAVFLTYLLKQRRRALRFALLQGGLILVGMAILHYLSQGRFFTLMFRYNVMPFLSDQLIRYLTTYSPFAALLALLAIRAKSAPRVVWIHVVLSMWVVLGSGRQNADYNYFLEMHCSLALLAAWGWSERRDLLSSLSALAAIAAIGMFLPLGPTFYCPWQYLRYESIPLWSGREPKYMQVGRSACDDLQKLLAKHPGPVIAENMGHALLAGRIPWMCDPTTFMVLAQQGRWDEEQVLSQLREGKVAVVLLQRIEGNPRFTPTFVRTVLENYQHVGVVGVENVFLPRTP